MCAAPPHRVKIARLRDLAGDGAAQLVQPFRDPLRGGAGALGRLDYLDLAGAMTRQLRLGRFELRFQGGA